MGMHIPTCPQCLVAASLFKEPQPGLWVLGIVDQLAISGYSSQLAASQPVLVSYYLSPTSDSEWKQLAFIQSTWCG